MAEATAMRLEDWLDDLCVRFIINLPREELESVERICFQVEEAQWFYEDFIRPLDPNLPSMSLRQFALRIFQHCPLMSEWSHHHHTAAFSEFLAYKTRVPVRGAILLNHAMDEVVLVKGWKKNANWSFPRGKINKDEKDLDCAVREVHEETGLDIKAAGLVNDEKNVKYIEIPMREQNMRLYVVRDVPKDTHFEPRTRKEISKIEWYKLSELPTLKRSKQAGLDGQNINGNANKFYMVAPFLGPLRKWIAQQRKLDLAKGPDPGAASHTLDTQEASYQFEPVDVGSSSNGGVPQRRFPSDLPEVSNIQDASEQMKRLLNIGTAPKVSEAPPPQQHIAPEPTKGNALLALLRQGSGGLGSPPPISGPPVSLASQPENTPSRSLPEPFSWQANAPYSLPSQQSRPTPMPNQHGQPYPAHVPHAYPQNDPNRTYRTGPDGRPYYPTQIPYGMSPINHQPGAPPHPTREAPKNLQPPSFPLRNPSSVPHAPIQAPAQEMGRTPAPYQRTGDPQFAQGARFPNANVPSVPPASKLPMPKLTSHSLKLLNAFKKDSAEGEQPVAPELPSQTPTQRKSAGGDKSQHQNDLLKLLQQERESSSRRESVAAHVELATASSPLPSMPEPIKILKNGSRVSNSQMRSNESATKEPDVTHGSDATLSGPLNLPNFEAAKSSRKHHGKQHKTADKDVKGPQPSNITILPRPAETKAQPSATTSVSEQPRSPVARNIKLADFAKPSAPKILRRPTKDNLEAYLPSQTVAVTEFSQPDKEIEDSDEKEEPRQVNYDRRPSQPAGQKEALLSLFGKTSTPVPRSIEVPNPAVSPPLATPPRSNVISPLPSASPPEHRSQPQLSGGKVTASPSSNAGSTSKERGKATSAGDKAFLLGYLNGVAKGNR